MRTWGGRDAWLDAAAAVLLVGAVALVAHDRLLPALREKPAAEEGDRVPRDVEVTALASGDEMNLRETGAAVLLVFQSTCPACGHNLPAWRRLLARRPAGLRALAVGLEPPSSALAYVRRELPGALAVRPRDPGDFARAFGLSTVPTTLLLDGKGRLRWRRDGVLADADLESFLTAAGPGAGEREATSEAGDAPPGDVPSNLNRGRIP